MILTKFVCKSAPKVIVNTRFITRFKNARTFASAIHNYKDESLKKLFDDLKYHELFQEKFHTQKYGLFRNEFLVDSSTGFQKLTDIVLRHSQRIVKDLLKTDGTNGKFIVAEFDRLSDLLCSVIDLCEFVRCAHTDEKIIAQSEDAYNRLFNFMNVLNTHRGLYDKIEQAVRIDKTQHQLGEEERIIADVFLMDFKKSAIDLEENKRKEFVTQSLKSATLGRKFFNNVVNRIQRYIKVPADELKGSNPFFSRTVLNEKGDHAYIPVNGQEGLHALINIANPSLRKKVYTESMYAKPDEIEVLESYLASKAELAAIVGKKSFADLQLSDKMVGNQDNVLEFLHTLASNNLRNVKSLSREVSRFKQQHLRLNELPTLDPWDRDFYLLRMKEAYARKLPSLHMNQSEIMCHMSVGTVMQGLSRLLNNLYGLRFEPATTWPGELWHPDVRKLHVYDDSGNVLGIVYCDLYARDGKGDGAAHFTIRSSRQLDESSSRDAELLGFHLDKRVSTDGSSYQLPVIVLSCNFDKSLSFAGRTCLHFWDVKTLFHEMGHAIHSIMGCTKYQNLAGTRCATDFVELPSILMEHFMSSPDVLPLYARHYLTDEPLKKEALENFIRMENLSSAFDNQRQVCLALVDQEYHSSNVIQPTFDSTKVYEEIINKWSGFNAVPNGAWQVQFGHLYGYSGTYYSYLFDSILANKVWSKLFAKRPLNREAGEKFLNAVLRWGGSRQPWLCLADALDDPRIAKGNHEVMETIGSWDLK
ncbi:intermediate peptidase Oct1 [Schizosaccharomyces japonicus yFS275]|uniref:Mitochondrial intermediate peptidase n=1 Tax=Schizosaccharomyces japonicus (strain yFS275 / FY16936) TaxID=402676 RepID=B6JX78_SCHJY|nr:intermediate peptidase Oct1 [Schizosaccharomyces japonicus yFS275]EEB05979.1 intermediate peptidase Oct1 [Schizosaccharomyces japonicus yFS275]